MATATPRPVQRPPKFPERYVAIRRIAAGGTATVWCAEDRLLGRRVAVKILAQPYASDHEAVRRFTREARAAARLSGHPHVVTIYDVGETLAERAPSSRTCPFIVMEHLSGGTVADALRVGAASLDDAVTWLHQAAAAIDYAHSKGVLHRDIKPANLLLDGHRQLHVADFGIAQLGWEDTMANTGHVMGTASYLPPERVLGRPATAASDLYALAVTAFELLTGQPPFRADSFLAQARMHLEMPPPAVSSYDPNLPRRLDAILARGLAKDPRERWPSAEAFATAVGEALAPSARPARRAGLVPATARSAAVTRARRALATQRQPRREPPRAAPRVPPRGTPKPAPRPSRRPTGLVAALASALTLAVLAFAWAQGADRPPARAIHIARSSRHAGIAAARDRRPKRAVPPPARAHHSKPPSSPPPVQAVQAVPAAATTPSAGADALEAQGHALLQAGQAAEAVPILRRAVAAATPGSLTYGYALFDLGEALLQTGHPADAARIFWQRLRIPDQTGVVRAALQQALEALAAQSGQAVEEPPGHKHHHHGPAGGESD